MTSLDLLIQQAINGVSLGAMYSLIALGFTLVYGILELINFFPLQRPSWSAPSLPITCCKPSDWTANRRS